MRHRGVEVNEVNTRRATFSAFNGHLSSCGYRRAGVWDSVSAVLYGVCQRCPHQGMWPFMTVAH